MNMVPTLVISKFTAIFSQQNATQSFAFKLNIRNVLVSAVCIYGKTDLSSNIQSVATHNGKHQFYSKRKLKLKC